MPNRQEEFLIHSLEDLQVFADKLALELQGGEVIALQGELGAGKTTLVKFLAAALGVNQEVSSPTFALERQYATLIFHCENRPLIKARYMSKKSKPYSTICAVLRKA